MSLPTICIIGSAVGSILGILAFILAAATGRLKPNGGRVDPVALDAEAAHGLTAEEIADVLARYRVQQSVRDAQRAAEQAAKVSRESHVVGMT